MKSMARIGFTSIRRIATAVVLLACSTVASLAEVNTNAIVADDIALSKSVVSLLVAGDYAGVRNSLNPSMGRLSDETMRRMSDVVGSSKSISMKTYLAEQNHDPMTGDGLSRIVLESHVGDKWVVVDTIVETSATEKQLNRLLFNSNPVSLSELNAFHLFGKGPKQYLFLAAWIATIVVAGWAAMLAFRRNRGWRRWLLSIVMFSGWTPSLAMYWNTAETWILEGSSNPTSLVSASFFVRLDSTIFAIRFPAALFGFEPHGTTFLYISAPLAAIGYLLWLWARPLMSRSIVSRPQEFRADSTSLQTVDTMGSPEPRP